MSEAVRRGRGARESRSWITVLLGGVCLVGLGLGLGIAFGLAWQDAGVFVGQATGVAEEFELAPPDREGAAPVAELVRERPDPEVAAAGEEAPAAEGPPAPAAVEAAPPGAGFAVQVGAFRESARAEELAESLRKEGHPVYLSPGAGAARWRVRVGPLESRERALAVARALAGRGLPTWVLEETER